MLPKPVFASGTARTKLSDASSLSCCFGSKIDANHPKPSISDGRLRDTVDHAVKISGLDTYTWLDCLKDMGRQGTCRGTCSGVAYVRI